MKNNKITVLFVLFYLIFAAFITPGNISAGELDLLQKKSFTVEPGKDFILVTDGGDVNLSTWNRNEVEIKIFGNKEAKKRFDFKFENDTDYVKVTGLKHKSSFFDWFSSVRLRYEIMVPQKFTADIKTAGGDIKIKNLNGDALVTTSGGDIKLKNINGDAEAKTSGGDIKVENVKGETVLKTSGGDINSENIEGDLTAKTSGGDIKLENIDGKINASTSGGDVSLVFTGENKGIELYTSGGDIYVEVPEDFSADINLKTVGGEISVGLENLKNIKTSRFSFTGKVGSAEYPLTAKTTGGDITVDKF